MTPRPSLRLTAIVLLLLSALGQAPSARAGDPVMNYLELEAIAKASINAEVDDLNQIVASMFSDSLPEDRNGYRARDLKIFKKFHKPDGLRADVLYDICLLTNETISAITSTQITRQNLKVTSNITAVNSLKSSMNGKFFRIAERACRNARTRFIERLQTATQAGASLNLQADCLENVAGVVFFPTDYAKPTMKKTLFRALPFVINGFLIISRVTSIAGIVLDTIWMSITTITSSSFAIKNLLPGPDQIFKQRNISEVDSRDGLRIDLSAEEAALLKQ